MKFKPVQSRKISDQVFDQLRELIFRGELKPSEQLLSERELAEVLNVSRTTVRSAVNKLVTLGLLEHKQGKGTFVKSFENRSDNPIAAAMDANNASIIDLLEVRMGLECVSATLAARRASKNDLEFLERSLKEMDSEVDSGRLGNEADVSFHMAVAYSTKNPVQVYMMKNFYDYLFSGIKKNLKHLYQEPDKFKTIQNQHREIFELIKSGNEEKSFKVMQEHITFLLDYYKDLKSGHEPFVPGE